jgi:hypothetical protein
MSAPRSVSVQHVSVWAISAGLTVRDAGRPPPGTNAPPYRFPKLWHPAGTHNPETDESDERSEIRNAAVFSVNRGAQRRNRTADTGIFNPLKLCVLRVVLQQLREHWHPAGTRFSGGLSSTRLFLAQAFTKEVRQLLRRQAPVHTKHHAAILVTEIGSDKRGLYTLGSKKGAHAPA